LKIRMKMEVANPLGESAVKTVPTAPRLDTLDGKTICELSSNMYTAEMSFPILREMLRKRYPDIRVVPFTEMDEELPESTVMTYSGKIADQEQKTNAVVALAKKKGCDAVIVGNGG
jgi:hypothetical protein